MSRVVFSLTQAQVKVLLQDQRKRWSRYQSYKTYGSLERLGLVDERKGKLQLTVLGELLVMFLRHTDLGGPGVM